MRKQLAQVGTASVLMLATLVGSESYTYRAVIPVPGDPPTYGHGSTFRMDGTPVCMGDVISRQDAYILMETKVNNEYLAGLKKCAGDIEVTEGEANAMIDLAYNIGVAAVCRSTMVRRFKEGRYSEGCQAIMLFNRLHGRNCSLPQNRNRKDGCRGIMKRRNHQYNMCMSGKG